LKKYNTSEVIITLLNKNIDLNWILNYLEIAQSPQQSIKIIPKLVSNELSKGSFLEGIKELP